MYSWIALEVVLGAELPGPQFCQLPGRMANARGGRIWQIFQSLFIDFYAYLDRINEIRIVSIIIKKSMPRLVVLRGVRIRFYTPQCGKSSAWSI